MKKIDDLLFVVECGPIDRELLRPVAGEPAGGRPEEGVMDRRSGDAAVGQLPRMPPQVASPGEQLHHPLDLFKERPVVRVGPPEAEALMEARDLVGACQPAALQLFQQFQLGSRYALAIAEFELVQSVEQSRSFFGHDGALLGKSGLSPEDTAESSARDHSHLRCGPPRRRDGGAWEYLGTGAIRPAGSRGQEPPAAAWRGRGRKP